MFGECKRLPKKHTIGSDRRKAVPITQQRHRRNQAKQKRSWSKSPIMSSSMNFCTFSCTLEALQSSKMYNHNTDCSWPGALLFNMMAPGAATSLAVQLHGQLCSLQLVHLLKVLPARPQLGNYLPP